MSLYRLIRLAKKTGDRFIVHNETDSSNIVIMDLDNYERLVDFSDPDDFGFRDDVGGDMSPWKPAPAPWDTPSSFVEKYPWENEEEPEYGSDEWFKNQHESSEPDDWSSIGDVMEDRYGGLHQEDIPVEHEIAEDEIPPFTPEEEVFAEIQPEVSTEPTIEPIPEPVSSVLSDMNEQTIVLADEAVETISEVSGDSVSVPPPSDVLTTEEPLSDGPVFYEEPT